MPAEKPTLGPHCRQSDSSLHCAKKFYYKECLLNLIFQESWLFHLVIAAIYFQQWHTSRLNTMILQKLVLWWQLCVQIFAVNCRKSVCSVKAKETGTSEFTLLRFPSKHQSKHLTLDSTIAFIDVNQE